MIQEFVDRFIKQQDTLFTARAGTNRKRSGMKLRYAKTARSLDRLREEAA